MKMKKRYGIEYERVGFAINNDFYLLFKQIAHEHEIRLNILAEIYITNFLSIGYNGLKDISKVELSYEALYPHPSRTATCTLSNMYRRYIYESIPHGSDVTAVHRPW